MNFAVPALRQTIGTNFTVPAGETWIVKCISLQAGSLPVNPNRINAVISGNPYTLYSTAIVSDTDISKGGGALINTLVLNAGDTITTTVSIAIGYWKLSDFNISTTVPAIRQATIAIPDLVVTTQTLTVPVGETWIVKIATAAYLDTGGTTGARIYSVDAVIGGNSYTNIWEVHYKGTTLVTSYTIASQIFDSSILLNAGDTITINIDSALTVNLSYFLEIGYWILEQDF